MKLYHRSNTLPLNTVMTADYKLVMPFLQALERSEDFLAEDEKLDA